MKLSIKYFLLLLLMLLISITLLKAQQDPLYTHYMFNQLVYNPAYAGVNPKFTCVKFLTHHQWTGFTGTNELYSGKAPMTQTFSINKAFKDRQYLGGMGLYIINDELGFEHNTSINFAASVKKYFNSGAVYLGLNSGFIQRQINNVHWIQPDGNDVFDPAIPAGKYNDILPDLGLGLYFLANNRLYFGLSSQHLLKGNFNWGNSSNELVRQSYVLAGYSFPWPSNPNFEIKPSVLYKIDQAKQQFDLNTNVWYKGTYWGGLQYRQGDAVSLLLGIQPSHWGFSYAYDLTLTDLNKISYGTHEFMITYCFTDICKGCGERRKWKRIIWSVRYM